MQARILWLLAAALAIQASSRAHAHQVNAQEDQQGRKYPGQGKRFAQPQDGNQHRKYRLGIDIGAAHSSAKLADRIYIKIISEKSSRHYDGGNGGHVRPLKGLPAYGCGLRPAERQDKKETETENPSHYVHGAIVRHQRLDQDKIDGIHDGIEE